MEQKQLDRLFKRYSRTFSDLAFVLAYGSRLPMSRTALRAIADSWTSLDGDGRAAVSGRLAEMVSELVPVLKDAEPEGNGITPTQAFRQQRGLSAAAAAERALEIVSEFDYGERQRDYLNGRFVREGMIVVPGLTSRHPDETYLLSASGDDRFREQNLRFAPNTLLGENDISGRTIKDVFENIVRPAAERQASILGVQDGPQRDEYIYQNGYRPLWTIWAKQNKAALIELRSHLVESVDGTSTTMTRVRRLVDMSSSSRMTPARVLEDLMDRGVTEFNEQDIKQMFSASSPLQPDPRFGRTDINEYNIYTIGMGNLSESDFWRLVPEDTGVMVFLRATSVNNHNRQFARPRLEQNAAQRNIGEVSWPVLSVRSKAEKEEMKKLMGQAPLYEVSHGGTKYTDFGRLEDDASFQKNVEEQILKYVREGKKVCIVGNQSSFTRGAGANRALLLGQYIEKNTDFRVAHIDGGRDGHGVRVMSQEEACMMALPPRAAIDGGTTKDLKFLAPASATKEPRYSLPLGVEVRLRMAPGQDPAERMIQGRWNYGTEVQFLDYETLPWSRDLRSRFDAMLSGLGMDAAQVQAVRMFAENNNERPVSPLQFVSFLDKCVKEGVDIPDVLKIPDGQRMREERVFGTIVSKFNEAFPRGELSFGSSRGLGGEKSFYDSIKANIEYSNFTVVFAASGEGGDKNVSEVEEMASLRDMQKIRIPETSEDCYSPEVIEKAAQSLGKSLTRSIAYQYSRYGASAVDMDDIKVYVTGSAFPRIANQRVELAPVGDEYGEDYNGYKEDRPLGPSQDDTDYFVQEVLRRAFRERVNEFLADGDVKLFTVGTVCSHYDTGAGEAGITAAQALGLKPVVISSNNAFTEARGDSIYGEVHHDPAYFHNRAHRALRKMVTDEMVAEQVEVVEEQRDKVEAQEPVGLTDRQVLLLYELGLDNNAILDAIAQAEAKAVRLNTAEDIVQFLDGCATDGVEIPENLRPDNLDAADLVEAAYDRVFAAQERWQKAGISYITAVSPLYPESMNDMQEYTEKRTRSLPVVQNDGVVSFRSEVYDHAVRRPAILWCRGDLSLLQEPSVGILSGAAVDSNTDKSVVREFCSAVTEEDLPVVASLDDATTLSGVFDTLNKDGGRVIAVTGEPFHVDDETSARRLQDVGQKVSRLNDAVAAMILVSGDDIKAAVARHPDGGDISLVEAEQISSSPEAAQSLFSVMSLHGDLIREAVQRFPADTAHRAVERLRDDAQSERYLLKSAGVSETENAQDEVVRKGGLVVTDKAPDSKEVPQPSVSRRIVAGISSAAAVLDQALNSKPMGLVAMTLYAVAGIAYVTTRSVEKIAALMRAAAAEKEELAAEAAENKRVNRAERLLETADEYKELADRMPSVAIEVSQNAEDEETMRTVADAGRLVAEQARAEHEAKQQRRDERAETLDEATGKKKSVYSRIKERLDPLLGVDFDKLFSGKDEGQDQAAEKAPLKDLRPQRQMPIEVLSYRGKRTFFVPDSQPHIAEAVRQRYGKDVQIMDPSMKRQVQEALELGRVDGRDRFRMPDGTGLLPHSAYTYKVYFHEGVVYGVNRVPSGIMGLPPKVERIQSANAWNAFMKNMQSFQREWLRQAGIPPQAGTAQLRCENADYMVFSPNRIEVRRGDELRCFVEYKDGVIRAGNAKIKDFSEYHETPTYDILSTLPRSGRSLQPADLDVVADEIRDALGGVLSLETGEIYFAGRPRAEQRAMEEIMADRAKREEYEEKLSNGFIVPRADNMSIAVEDVARAMHEGLIPDDMKDYERQEPFVVYAAASRQEKKVEASVRSLERQIMKVQTKLDALEKALAAKGVDITEGDAQREELEDRMSDLLAHRRKGLMDIADMEDVRNALLEGVVPYGTSTKVVLDGMTFSMRSLRVSREEKLAAAEVLKHTFPDEYRNEMMIEDARKEQQQQPAPSETPVAEAPSQTSGMQPDAVSVQEPPQEAVPEASPAEAQAPSPESESLSPQQRLDRLDEEIAALQARGDDMSSDAVFSLLQERDALQKDILRDAVVPDSESNGLRVVNTPEGQRYVNEEMEFVSEAYPCLRKMGRTIGCAYENADGTGAMKLIRLDGSEVSPMWFDRLAKTQLNHILVAIAKDGGQYVLNRHTGSITAGPFVDIRDFREERSRVQRSDGRYNFLNEKGELMQQSMWFDDATNFKDGVADVRIEMTAETRYITFDRDLHSREMKREPKKVTGIKEPKKSPEKPSEKQDKGTNPGHPGKK